jgi:hypothetical protein
MSLVPVLSDEKVEEDMIKTVHAYRRGKSRSNRSLLMLGIAVLDCAFLFLCILIFGLLIRLFITLV